MSDLLLADIDVVGGNFKFTHVQDIAPVFNSNEEIRKNSDEDWSKAGHMKQVGRVPVSVWLLWESMGITEDPKELLKALERNPEWKTTVKQLA